MNGVQVAQGLYDGDGERALNYQRPTDNSPAQETGIRIREIKFVR